MRPFDTILRLMAMMVLSAGLLCGCVSTRGRENAVRESAGLQTDVKNLRDESAAALLRLDAVEIGLRKAEDRGNSAEDARKTDMAGLERKITALESRMAALEAAREKDKKEIVDKLSEAMAELVNRKLSQQSPRPVQQQRTESPGVEHIVKDGETLGSISRLYGASVQAIVAANDLKNADSIKAGQKLVIPK